MAERTTSRSGHFEVTCPHCGARFLAPDRLAGRSAKCLKCAESFALPSRRAPPRQIEAIPRDSAERHPERPRSTFLPYAWGAIAGLAVGIAIGFAAAWILRFGGSESAQLVARLQQLEQQQTGLRQHYDGRLRDLQANNARLSGELQSAHDVAEQERSKGNELLRRLQSAENPDLEKLVDGNVVEAAETFLEMLGGARPGAGRTEYERLRWDYTGSNETPIFRIHEPVWRLVWNLPSTRESITMHVFRGERTRDGRPAPVDTISGQGSGAKRINATPGLFYLRIEVRGKAEVSIEPAEVSIDATD